MEIGNQADKPLYSATRHNVWVAERRGLRAAFAIPDRRVGDDRAAAADRIDRRLAAT